MRFYTILIIVFALIYLISPIDLIPDFFGLPGRVDDLAVLIIAIWYITELSQRYLSKIPGSTDAGRGGSYEENRFRTGTSSQQNEEEGDPFKILGVKRGAPFEEVTRAYRELLTKYHPDKVSHLGKEFQEIAERKTKRLNKAYQEIKEYYQK